MRKWHAAVVVLLICAILIALYFGGFIPMPSEEPSFAENAREVISYIEASESTPEHFAGINRN